MAKLSHSGSGTHSWLHTAVRGATFISAAGLPLFFLFFLPPPLAGGGHEDGWRARRLKDAVYLEMRHADRGHRRLSLQNANGWHALYAEPLQPLSHYVSSVAPLGKGRDMPVPRLVVLPIGEWRGARKQLLREVSTYLALFFGVPVQVQQELERSHLTTTMTTGRNTTQFQSKVVLQEILAPQRPEGAVALVGLTDVDLGSEEMNFVFGEADMEERVAICSLARLESGRASGGEHAKTKPLLLRRACQLATHETGHALGLWHCGFYKCLMNGSSGLQDSDGTPLELCPVCLHKVAWRLGWTEKAALRKRKLVSFLQEGGLQQDALAVQATVGEQN